MTKKGGQKADKIRNSSPLFIDRKIRIVHEAMISLRNYTGTLRQVVIRNNGRETPAFLVTNDFDMPLELIVGNYACRWRVEDVIAEAGKFFHLNALSSPILVKVRVDVLMTMIAFPCTTFH
ncbi:MAG: transposase [Desulfatiglandales bacterium]|jgi:hypothetical protein|nr:transposase [Desulfatiglandales bacterium]